jgi:SPP1 family predicted phage head-tail adaptor
MEAGKLRHRVQVQHSVPAQDDYGEPLEVMASVGLALTSAEDLAGREYFTAQQTKSEVTTRFRTRWIGSVTPEMRILHDGRLYDVASVQDPDGRRRELIIMASRKG